MPRSIEEIDAEIAEVKARMAQRQAYGYGAARARAVLDHDPSGYVQVNQMVAQAAENKRARDAQVAAAELQRLFQKEESEKQRKFTEEQNRLSRESSERMHEKGMAADLAEKMYQWQKDRAVANAVYRDLLGKKSSERDVREAQANMNWLDSVGKLRGYIREDADPNYANQEADDYIKTMSRWEEVYPGLEKLLATENVSTDELRGGKDQLAEFVKFQPLHKDYQEYLARFANAIEKNRGKDWEKLKGNSKGRIADPRSTQSELRGIYNEMSDYSDQKDYEPERTALTKAIAARAGIPLEALNRASGITRGEVVSASDGKTHIPVRGKKNMYLTTKQDANGKYGVYYMGKSRIGTYSNGKFTLEI